MASVITKLDASTIQIETTTVETVDVTTYVAGLTARIADLRAARDSYDPIIAEVEAQLAAALAPAKDGAR